MKIFYSPTYTAAGHDFDTTRKATWVAESLTERPIDGVTIAAPNSLTAEQIARVHSPIYVEAVRTGRPKRIAETNGFAWDDQIFPMVAASNGGIVDATVLALETGENSGSLSSGLHHARHVEGSGFCTFNGLALAADAALKAGAETVAIIDFDAHGGGGTDELLWIHERLYESVWHADVSVDSFDRHGGGKYGTYELVGREDGHLYLDAIERSLAAIPTVDVAIYNAGMDPYEGCFIGGLDGVTEELLRLREQMVYEWAKEKGVPTSFALAGGYIGAAFTVEQLVGLHRTTIEEAAR